MVVTKMTVKKQNLSAKSHPAPVAFNYFLAMFVTVSVSVAKSNLPPCELLLGACGVPREADGSPRPAASQSWAAASLQLHEVGVETQKRLQLHGTEVWALRLPNLWPLQSR